MKSTIDSAGRLVIPRDLRRAAGIEPGMPLELRVEDGAVVIEPAATPVRIERRGRFVVARPLAEIPSMTNETVERTRSQLRAERGAYGGRKKK
ncbi:MAG: AbrB/MazE/SpoVT family DNA-binding domain-containing protein [Myxococcales bacterium]